MYYVSDILKNEIVYWENNASVYIEAPTGAGKTTFILQYLLPVALAQRQEILYLSNRKILHQQLIKSLCEMYKIPFELMKDEGIAEFKGITVMTYQTLEMILVSKVCIAHPIPFFYYTVLDEIHYIATDSEFNSHTWRIEKWIRGQMLRNIMIAISATLDAALPYLDFYKNEWEVQYRDDQTFQTVYARPSHNIVDSIRGQPEYLHFYTIPRKSVDYHVFVYDDISQVVEKINADPDEKWVIFQANKERASRKVLKEVKKQCILLTAEDKESEEMQKIVEECCFSSQILLTTKVLDCGVSLHDSTIKNIVLETTDQTEFLQMLGRRRVEFNEDVVMKIYIPRYSAKWFGTLLHAQIYPTIKMMNMPIYKLQENILKNKDIYAFCQRFIDSSGNNWVLNEIAYSEINFKKRFFEKIYDQLLENENAFVETQIGWLGESDIEVTFLTDEKRRNTRDELQKFLESVKTIEINQDAQNEFRQKMTEFLQILNPDEVSHKGRIMGISTINKFLEKLDFPERIISISGKRKGEKSKWKIQ